MSTSTRPYEPTREDAWRDYLRVRDDALERATIAVRAVERLLAHPFCAGPTVARVQAVRASIATGACRSAVEAIAIEADAKWAREGFHR